MREGGGGGGSGRGGGYLRLEGCILVVGSCCFGRDFLIMHGGLEFRFGICLHGFFRFLSLERRV